MIERLYQEAILNQARAAVGAGRLDTADGSATVDNPLCGDRVTIDILMDGDRVATIGHKVRGCILCEAAASIIGARAIGLSAADLHSLADAMERMLRDGGSVPPEWPDLAVFEPVRPIASRHECVLLPFQALDRALRDAGA